MVCKELEALRLGLMNVLGSEDESVRQHAEAELGEDVSGPVEALAGAGSLAEVRRHLDAALVDLEEEVAAADTDSDEYDYLRGRLVAVRDAERSVARLADQGESLLDDLGESHHTLHEAFPVEE
jgi:predicted NUDIX family phosphoesterase